MAYLGGYIWQNSRCSQYELLLQSEVNLICPDGGVNCYEQVLMRNSQLAWTLMEQVFSLILKQFVQYFQISELRSIFKLATLFIIRSGSLLHLDQIIHVYQLKKRHIEIPRISAILVPLCNSYISQRSYQALDKFICSGRSSLSIGPKTLLRTFKACFHQHSD